MNKYLQNIIREELLNALKEEEIPTSPFTDAEEKFLAKFVELGTQSLGILYTKNEVGIREFLMRSGKDYNLTPDVLSKLMKDGIISIVPYGGYARNEDYTIKCNLPLDELEGLSSGDSKEGDDDAPPPADDAGDTPETDTAPLDDTGDPQESASSSLDLSKLLVSEQKRHTSTRVYTNKSRALRRLPKGYVVYLEKIIKILGQKLHTDLEKQHLVADILDNLAHNFGLTPKQVYKSFIFYNSQNRLKNVVREQLENDEDMIKLKELLEQQKTITKTLPSVSFDGVFLPNYITPSDKWKAVADKLVIEIKKYLKDNYKLANIKISINGGADPLPATNGYTGPKPPKHNFKVVGQTKGGLLPADWTNIRSARVNIGEPQGNTFLALNRALNLKKLLIPYLSSKLGEKIPESNIIATGKTGVEKTVHATITPTVSKTDQPTPKYVIQYPWYIVDNQPNMVLVDGNIAAGWRQNEKAGMSLKWYQSTITDKNIRYSGFQKGGQASGLINAYAFIKLNADSYRGSMAIYKDEKSWLADVKKMTIYAPGLQVGELTLGPPNSNKNLPGYRGADGYLDKTGKSKYTGLAKFNMGSKDYIVSSGIPYYLFKPQGDKAFYMADLFKAKNQAKAPATGAYDSDGNRSLIVGKKYAVWKGVNLTPDNLARKKETGKAIKNPNALVYTGKTTIKTFKS